MSYVDAIFKKRKNIDTFHFFPITLHLSSIFIFYLLLLFLYLWLSSLFQYQFSANWASAMLESSFKWVFQISNVFFKHLIFPMTRFPQFKIGLSPSKKMCVICLTESPLRMMKNTFYFILKALLVLKIFKFLSWLFGHVGKMAWLER